MSLSDTRTRPDPGRRNILLGGLACLALPACQFRPALSDRGPASALFGQIQMAAPIREADFLMTQRLEERLGRAGDGSPFELSYRLNIVSDNIGTDRDGVNQRVHLQGRATYNLRRRAGAVLSTGEVENFTGYSTTGNTVSTRAASDDARERLIRILADEIVARILQASPDLRL